MTQLGTFEPLTSVGPDEVLQEAAEKLELTDNLVELDQQGFTVVRPEKVGSIDFLDELRDAVVDVHQRRSADTKKVGMLKAGAAAGAGELSGYVLWEDAIFERALLNPVAQTLARAMTGHTCRLTLMMAGVKPSADAKLGLHCDTEMTEPYPPVAQYCNVTYALSDYSAEHGSTLFVPGSHRLMRQPRGTEINGDFSVSSVAGGLSIPKPLAVECPAGSIVAWNGLTWHGAVPRTVEGARISLVMVFCRWYLAQQERYQDHVPAGALERNVPRFAQLLDVVPGWAIKGDPYMDPATAMTARKVYPILDVERP